MYRLVLIDDERARSFTEAICLSLQGARALEAVDARKRWLHLGCLKLVEMRCGHTLA